jgi:DNA-directed RNA polymerase subunit RPC12/RpoP
MIELLTAILVVGAIAGVASLPWVVFLMVTERWVRCPKCTSVRLTSNNQRIASEEKADGLVQRELFWFNPSAGGCNFGTIDQRAPVVKKTFLTEYVCRSCGYQFSASHTEQHEDFTGQRHS